MTITKPTKKQQKRKQSNAWKECVYCGQDIHEQNWFTDMEGLHFCDQDCGRFHREEVKNCE